MTPYPTCDSWGHVESEAEANKIREAVQILNGSETVDAWEESGNLHHAAEYRHEMAGNVHVADIGEWTRDDGGWETATCTVCGRVLEREAQ